MKFKLKDLLHLVFLMIFSSVIIYSLKLQGLFIVLILLFYILQKNMCIRTLKNDFKKEREICIKSLNHDLKVATLAQKRALDILAKNNQDDIEIIEEMQNSCNYSLEMIDTLINAYRVCSNKKYLCFQEVNIFDLINEASYSLEKMLKDKNIELYVKSEEKGYIYADRSLLLNLLQVLLSVALLNSEADKKIKLTIKKDNEKILVIISYEGRPFSISECENLFTEKSCLTTVGLGIKMYFCKKIVEIHGGTIQAQTYGENINMFTFKLPISKNKKTLKTIDLCALKRCSI